MDALLIVAAVAFIAGLVVGVLYSKVAKWDRESDNGSNGKG